MNVSKDFDRGTILTERLVWMVLIIVSGTCLSSFFACVTPFAALATLAALKLDQRDAFAVVGSVWLMNQAIGFVFLSYPWTWDSVSWGLAIGVSSGLAILAARGLSTRHSVSVAVSLPLVAAFAAFELGLYVAGLVLPTSEGAFSVSVIWLVFLTNAVALCGLMIIYQAASMLGFLAGRNERGMINLKVIS